jgi:hypothetical protein
LPPDAAMPGALAPAPHERDSTFSFKSSFEAWLNRTWGARGLSFHTDRPKSNLAALTSGEWALPKKMSTCHLPLTD